MPHPDICVLRGSPRAEGATARALTAFMQALPPAWTRADFAAYTMAARPCEGCGYCDAHPLRCRHRDLDGFRAALEGCAFWVIATPVYHRGFPAPLKAVLDRLQPYYAARFTHGLRPPIAAPRQVALLTAGGGDIKGGREDGRYLEEQLAPQLTVLNARLTAVCHLTGLDGGWTAAHEAQARAAGERFAANG